MRPTAFVVTLASSNVGRMVGRSAVFAALVLHAAFAAAQSVSSDRTPHVRAGQWVWVTSLTGVETQGTVASVTPDEIKLRQRGEESAIQWAQVKAGR
jgi:hypothetical protein